MVTSKISGAYQFYDAAAALVVDHELSDNRCVRL
jgi:hypothetical protein